MKQLNKDYNVDLYAPEFFIIGSDGSNTAYAIEKNRLHFRNAIYWDVKERSAF